MPDKHYHDKFEIYYLVTGERYYFIKDSTFKIKKGHLIFINAGELHKTTDTDKSDYKRILIHFKKEYINVHNASIEILFDKLTQKHYQVLSLSLKEQQSLEMIFNEMNEETEKKSFGYEIILRGLLMKLLVLISRCIGNMDESAYVSHDPKHEKISEIVKYINTHYKEVITISSLSKQFFISPHYLSRIFKKTTGFTIIEYINNIRVKNAQKLLTDYGEKVIQVLEETGFGSIANFNRVFKAITGCSPVSYRKTYTCHYIK
jgi:YesN/AraC family two-component response regulator